MKRMVSWYIKNIRGTYNLSKWRSGFYCVGIDKPFMILTGEKNIKSLSIDNHMRYLWRFNYLNTINTILYRIDTHKLWIMPATSLIKDFEDVYQYVWNTINSPSIPYIKQLAIYDISLHLVWLWGNKSLMPKKYVYIHALPYRAYIRLVREGIIKKFPISHGKIDTIYLYPDFPSLQADEIEDLLCHIGKSIRKIDKMGGRVTIPNIIANL